jgi:hypothetical protein
MTDRVPRPAPLANRALRRRSLPRLVTVAALVAALAPLAPSGQADPPATPARYELAPVVMGHVVYDNPEGRDAPRYQNAIVAGTKLFYEHGVRPPRVSVVRNYVGTFEFGLPVIQAGEKFLSAHLQLLETGRGGRCEGADGFSFEVSTYEGDGKPNPDDAEGGDVVASVTVSTSDRQLFPEPIDVTEAVGDELFAITHPLNSFGSTFNFSGIIGFNVRQTNEATCQRYFDARLVRLVIEYQPVTFGSLGVRG